MKPTKIPVIDTDSAEYANMVQMLATYSRAENHLTEMEVAANRGLAFILDKVKREYADLQQLKADCTAALEVIARSHPEWFVERQSLKTPYGTVKFRKSTKLEVANAEASILLVEKIFPDATDTYVKTKQELDLEAIEKLDDATLKRLRIARVSDDNFSVVAATVDMGKAVKEAAAQAA